MKTISILILAAILCSINTSAQSTLWIHQLASTNFLKVDQLNRPASFPHRFDFDLFLKEHLDYPKAARDYAISDSVIVGIEISCQGDLESLQILKTAGYGFDEAVVNAIRKLPRLVPAMQDGKPVKSEARIKLHFKRE